jgi:hypothetical protein
LFKKFILIGSAAVISAALLTGAYTAKTPPHEQYSISSAKIITAEKAIELFKAKYPNARITSTSFSEFGSRRDWAISFTIPSQINKGMSIYGTACVDAITGEVKPATTTAN